MKMLPKQAFDEIIATKKNSHLFYINGCVIFPPNIKEVASATY
jgi:hypothetical protein